MNTVDILVGNRIRARRRAMGMSQAELGRLIGVRFQQVQKYETASNRVSASRLWAIADVLGVPVVHFFEGIQADNADGHGMQAIPRDYMAHLSDPELMELIERYCVLPSGHKQAVMAVIRSMASSETSGQIGLTT